MGRLDLCREFRDNPLGPHSLELQKLIKLLRWEPVDNRYLLAQTERNGPWYLAYASGPKSRPLEIFRDRAFATLHEGWWALFKARWECLAGQRMVLDGVDDPPIPRPGEGEPTGALVDRPLLSYSDRFSVPAGGRIAFKVSSRDDLPYRADIIRLRCGDASPGGVGHKQEAVGTPIDGEYPGRFQPIDAGSYAEIGDIPAVPGDGGVALQAWIWPTAPGGRAQAVMGNWDASAGSGFALAIDESGALVFHVGDGTQQMTVSTGTPLLERHWYLVAASFDPDTGRAWVGQRPLLGYARDDTTAEQEASAPVPAAGPGFRIAAWHGRDGERLIPAGHYNGKIDSPVLAAGALTAEERRVILAEGNPAAIADAAARWDFSRDIPGLTIRDVSGNDCHGTTVNLPTRAMKGWNWDGSEYNWACKPEQYGAIHFHDDDLHDCGWETDFTFEVPEDLASGIYCAHLTRDGREDYCPFVVTAPPGRTEADLALLLPTASYWAYANRHVDLEWQERENVVGYWAALDSVSLYLCEHPELGVSMYDDHSDGSGVCLASRLRPILSMQPKERLWQFAADTHITDWLEARGIAYDVITEDDLDAAGTSLLEPYRCVITGTHPEYPSKSVLDAILDYQNRGGRFVYFGGNGFYWRVSYSPDIPGAMEMRRAEDGIRSWLAEGGEYYHAFTGELGGMWRRMGRPPQSVAGTGMTAQGFDYSASYARNPESFDARAMFIFEGVGAEERIGDFGLFGGGAAGWEIDRADPALGTPPHALVVATATEFSAAYHWVKEELTHTHSANTGDTCPMVRCDMVFYETPNGGAVFSTSSIAWAGALAHNSYDNNVARISENVIRRFIDPQPL